MRKYAKAPMTCTKVLMLLLRMYNSAGMPDTMCRSSGNARMLLPDRTAEWLVKVDRHKMMIDAKLTRNHHLRQ